MASTSGVLYVDHAGHPAPLSLCYHATSSRTLSSSVDDRTDPSTSTEVDSAYCPQCLSFHDAATAASSDLRGACPRPTCRLCPVCRSALAVTVGAAPGAAAAADGGDGGGGKDVCYYSCGHCRWTSDECGVTAPAPESSGALGRAEVRAATEGLGDVLRGKVTAAGREKGAGAACSPVEAYKILVDGWSGRAKEEERRRREGDGAAVRGAGAAAGRRGGDGPGGWSVESLEEATRKRREVEAAKASAACVDGLGIGRIGLDDATDAETATPSSSLPRRTPEQASTQAVLGPGTVASVNALLPLPVPLRSRKSRRCRAELDAGRPGILIKPKVNPLEGDSSLRSGHGQWWKKDSSAIHVVPRVKVVRHGRISSAGAPARHALLLSVQNPTLGKVRLRLNGADLPERGRRAAGGDANGRVLRNVLIDAMARTYVDATVVGSTSTLVLPDIVELDPVEDAFLELGKGQSRDPKEVEEWNISKVRKDLDAGSKGGAVSSTTECPFRTISVQQDKAWIQLVVTEDDSPSPSSPGQFVAVPASLQIEVGDGSWESSLVKPRAVQDGESDLVNISLVIVWKC